MVTLMVTFRTNAFKLFNYDKEIKYEPLQEHVSYFSFLSEVYDRLTSLLLSLYYSAGGVTVVFSCSTTYPWHISTHIK